MVVTLKRLEIESILARNGMTNSALAEKCGIGRSNLSTMLNRGRCTFANAVRISDGLEVDVSEIIKEED